MSDRYELLKIKHCTVNAHDEAHTRGLVRFPPGRWSMLDAAGYRRNIPIPWSYILGVSWGAAFTPSFFFCSAEPLDYAGLVQAVEDGDGIHPLPLPHLTRWGGCTGSLTKPAGHSPPPDDADSFANWAYLWVTSTSNKYFQDFFPELKELLPEELSGWSYDVNHWLRYLEGIDEARMLEIASAFPVNLTPRYITGAF